VWLWNEFPGKNDLGGNDTGIDLVAVTHHNEYWAIQCKCYQETSTIDKPAVDSFLATSSREFKGEDLKTTRFTQRLWISTTNKWGPNAYEAIKNQHPPSISMRICVRKKWSSISARMNIRRDTSARCVGP